MGIYLLEIVSIFFMGFVFTMQKGQPKRKKLFLILTAMILILILGLRGQSVGEDTANYIRIANRAETMSWGDIFTGFPRSTYGTITYSNGTFYQETIESGYLILNKFIMEIFHSVVWVQLVVAIIICTGFMKFIYDNAENTFLAVWIFVCESIYVNAFNAQRQVLAMSIALQAFTETKKGRYYHAAGYILFAALFHASALIYLVMIPLSMIKDYKQGIKMCLIAMIGATTAVPLLVKIVVYIMPRYAAYLTNSYWESSIGGILIVWILEAVLCILLYRLGIDKYQDFMCVVFIIIYLGIEIMGLNATAISRLALYFRAFNILLFSGFINRVGKNLKLIYMFGIMALTFLQFYSSISSPTRFYTFFS